MNLDKALEAINQFGFLLVFPIQNQAHPNSLWNVLHPKLQMRWEWDETGDGKLFDLWRMREQLAASKKVVYGKYYKGRATFFSKDVFRDLICIKQDPEFPLQNRDAKNILDILEMDSPLSTKQLKSLSELQGPYNETRYNRALKELWSSLSVVAVGEIDDGAFPSLAHAATKTIFEDLWLEAQKTNVADAWLRLCDLPEFELLEKNFLT